jgi:hypothetical protein
LELEKADKQKEASTGIAVPTLRLETEKTRAAWPAGTSEDSIQGEQDTKDRGPSRESSPHDSIEDIINGLSGNILELEAKLEAEKWREEESVGSSDKERTLSASEEELKDLDFEIEHLDAQLEEERHQSSVLLQPEHDDDEDSGTYSSELSDEIARLEADLASERRRVSQESTGRVSKMEEANARPSQYNKDSESRDQ